jgi:hypothetical protein
MPDLWDAHGAERLLLQVRQLRGHKRMLLKRDCPDRSQASPCVQDLWKCLRFCTQTLRVPLGCGPVEMTESNAGTF